MYPQEMGWERGSFRTLLKRPTITQLRSRGKRVMWRVVPLAWNLWSYVQLAGDLFYTPAAGGLA